MSRRPYFDPKIIKSEYRVKGHYQDGYSSGAINKEVIGMDGRCDWFRANCRECGKKHITKRPEKSGRYYKCRHCDTLHHVYKGFFDLSRFETKPVRQDEVNVDLYRVKLRYNNLDGSWHYGSKEECERRADRDNYTVVEDIESVQ